jgi:hypothetical protein
MKNGVFWDVMPCGSCKNRHFGGTCHPDEGGAKFLRNVGSYKSHMSQHPRRHHSSISDLFVFKTMQKLLNKGVKFEVLTAAAMKSNCFLDVTSHNLVEVTAIFTESIASIFKVIK